MSGFEQLSDDWGPLNDIVGACCRYFCCVLLLQGALFIVIANTLAAVNAYSLSKGIGRKLAEKMVAREAGEQQGPVQQQIAAVTQAIESGGWLRQVTAITLLRLTPVVPFR